MTRETIRSPPRATFVGLLLSAGGLAVGVMTVVVMRVHLEMPVVERSWLEQDLIAEQEIEGQWVPVTDAATQAELVAKLERRFKIWEVSYRPIQWSNPEPGQLTVGMRFRDGLVLDAYISDSERHVKLFSVVSGPHESDCPAPQPTYTFCTCSLRETPERGACYEILAPPLVAATDITRAHIKKRGSHRSTMHLVLTPEAGERLLEHTREGVGGRLAWLNGDRVLFFANISSARARRVALEIDAPRDVVEILVSKILRSPPLPARLTRGRGRLIPAPSWPRYTYLAAASLALLGTVGSLFFSYRATRLLNRGASRFGDHPTTCS